VDATLIHVDGQTDMTKEMTKGNRHFSR
jgi:hypothetical protein